VVLGRVAGVFGVRGQLKIESWTDPREAIFDYPEWRIAPPGSPEEQLLQHREGRSQGKGLVVRLPGIESPEQGREWVGAEIRVLREQLPETAPGEYYWTDLEDLQVETTDGLSLGRVSHLVSTGSNDVLVVVGDRERLIPFLQPDTVRSVDIAAGRLIVDWDPEF